MREREREKEGERERVREKERERERASASSDHISEDNSEPELGVERKFQLAFFFFFCFVLNKHSLIRILIVIGH